MKHIQYFKDYLNESTDSDEKRLEFLEKQLQKYNRDDLMKSWQGNDKTLYNEYAVLDKERNELFNKIHGSFAERQAEAEKNRKEFLKNRFSKFDYNNNNILLRYISDEKKLDVYAFDINDEPQELPMYSFTITKTSVSSSNEYIININTLDSFLTKNNFNLQFKKDSLDAFYDVLKLFKDEYREYKATGNVAYLTDKNGKLIKY